jgi:hypothetical protein
MTAANRNQPVAQHQHSRPARQTLLGLFRPVAVQELVQYLGLPRQAKYTANTLQDYL